MKRLTKSERKMMVATNMMNKDILEDWFFWMNPETYLLPRNQECACIAQQLYAELKRYSTNGGKYAKTKFS